MFRRDKEDIRYEIIRYYNHEYIMVNRVITYKLPGLYYYYIWGSFTPSRLLYAPETNMFGGYSSTETLISMEPIDYFPQLSDENGRGYIEIPEGLVNNIERFRSANTWWSGGEEYSPALNLFLSMWKESR